MAKKIIDKTITGSVLTITVDGIEGSLTIDASTLNPAITQHAAMHGLSQKIGDAAASKKTPQERWDAMAAVIERFNAATGGDDWNAVRAGGDGGARVTILAEALVRVGTEAGKSIDLDTVVAMLSEATDDQKKALRADPTIKAAMSAIRLERDQEAAAKSENSDLLSAFLG